MEVEIGRVTHFYNHLNVAALRLTDGRKIPPQKCSSILFIRIYACTPTRSTSGTIVARGASVCGELNLRNALRF